MKLLIFRDLGELKEKRAIFQSNGSLLILNKEGNECLSSLIARARHQDLYFSIDEKEYSPKDLFILNVDIKKACSVVFIFPFFQNATEREGLCSSVLALRKMPVLTKQDTNAKVLRLLETVAPYRPLLGVSDKYISAIVEENMTELGFFFVMKNNPNDPKEKLYKEKRERFFNVWLSLFAEVVSTCLFFLSYWFMKNGNIVAFMIILFLAIIELFVFVYMIIETAKEKSFLKYLKKNLIIPFAGIGGILLGLGVSALLGAFLLAPIEETNFFALVGYAVLSSFALTVLFALISRLVVVHYLKGHNSNPFFPKAFVYLFARKKTDIHYIEGDEEYYIE